ncbi:hypothetical protein [Streptomyces niveus]|uniref:hypothetical protein n=1 Tax=Streptomyces niveus TaxID=193462 RepID=UPI003445988B
MRNPSKGVRALERIRAGAPGAVVSTRVLDLASLESVEQLADTLSNSARTISAIWP